jgi:small GTP-binding protein
MSDDETRLSELKELLLDSRSHENPFEWIRSDPLLIVPYGSGNSYALDDEHNVVGIKLASIKHRSEEILSKIAEFSSLQRLVFFCNEPWELSLKVLQLPLNFLSLGGSLERLPPQILELGLPITTDLPLFDVEWSWLAERARFGKETLSDRMVRRYSEREETALYKFLSKHVGVRSELEDRMVKSNSLRGVFIFSSVLEDPPLEIAQKGTDAIRRYFSERAAGWLPLNEVKVLLVGNGAAGKTSLVKNITGDKFNAKEEQTHGINIRSTSITTAAKTVVKLHFWDFGGQEIMHATHQFFLSKRSVYILVLDGRKEEDPEYWLQHIQSFGGDSPIFIILNKIDEHPAFDVNRRFLQTKYPMIVGFFRTSCASGLGISDFTGRLTEELGRVPLIQTRWPKAWFHVKQRLENWGTAYLSVEQYRQICTQERITTEEDQELLVDFLNDLGVVLHFRDFELLDTHVLDPKWVTEAVYRIINSEILARQKGILRLRQLAGALKPRRPDERVYPADKHRYIVDLMLKFELCYTLDDGAILIPDLLDIQEPPITFEASTMLRFVLEYPYLPRSIIPRFIVRMHRDIIGHQRWRTGVLLEDKSFDATALIRADEKANRIYVGVIGAQKRDYFAVIRKVLTEIAASFEKLPVRELVPLPDYPELTVEYGELLGHEVAAREEIFIGKLQKAYSVRMLLDGIEKESSRQAQVPTVYVSGDYYTQSSVSQGDRLIQIPAIDTQGDHMSYAPQPWEKIIVYMTGFLFIGLVAFLLIRNQPVADKNLVVALRVILSLVVAVFGATVPGMLKVDYSARGLSIRAMGALALFVLTFILTPRVL